MIADAAPKIERSRPASNIQGLDEKQIAERLLASPVRALRAAADVRLPPSPRGHEDEIFKSVMSRPSLPVDIKFKGSSDMLSVEAGKWLVKLARALADRRLAGQRILIGAQTDLLGTDAYNAEVAALRAHVIAEILAKRFGVNAERLEVVGFGRMKNAEPGSAIRVVNLGKFAGKAIAKSTEPGIARSNVKSAPEIAHAPHRSHDRSFVAERNSEPLKTQAPVRDTRRLGETKEPWPRDDSSLAPYGMARAGSGGAGTGGAGAGGAGAGGAGAGGAGAGGAGAGGAGAGGAGAGGAGAGGAGAGGAGAGGAGAGGAGAGGAGAGGAGAGGGAGGGGGGWSDRRLKRNIVHIGETASGLPLYHFEYIWGGPVYVGVMAQDVAILRPDALILDASGYFRVDYARLGLRMMTLDEYERSLCVQAA